MEGMFAEAGMFNQPVNFDTSSVHNMSWMFHGAWSFNQPLDLDTLSVTDMRCMFCNAGAFDQSLNFNTSSVRIMKDMFWNATTFNQPLNFDVSSATDMQYMFFNASSFNQNLCSWGELLNDRTINVSSMFHGTSCPLQEDPNLDSKPPGPFCHHCGELLCFEDGYDLYDAFRVPQSRSLHVYGSPIGSWCVNKVKDFSLTFSYLHNFNEPLSNWDTSMATK